MLVLLLCAGIVGWVLLSLVAGALLTVRLGGPTPEPLPQITGHSVDLAPLLTRDSQTLGAWLVEGDPARPAVVLLHGRGGSRTSNMPMMAMLADLGLTVLSVTQRAHGDSSGALCDVGLSSSLDVIAAVKLLHQRFPKHPVFILGRSMGAAAAVFASQELGATVHGYVLDSLYADLPRALKHRTQLLLPSPLDALANAGLRMVSPLALPPLETISPLNHLGDIPPAIPMLLLALFSTSPQLYRQVVSEFMKQ